MSTVVYYVDTNPTEEKKRRKIVIIKQEVYKDVELHTFKRVEAAADMTAKQENAISADTTENMDGAVIARYVEYRNAQLRRKMSSILLDMESLGADDVLSLDEVFAYNLSLSTDFKDAMLRPLAEYMHRFLVWGALYDWYNQLGMRSEAAIYGSELQEIEDEINNITRVPSWAKRPLQPFGPARKIF